MTLLPESLRGVRRLGFDTAPVIYFVEAHPEYDAQITPIFERIRQGELEGFTSVITLLEVLVQPIRLNRIDLVSRYRQLLLDSEHFSMLPITVESAELAAELRARYNLRTPDALQVATVLVRRCEAFLTNDARLKRVAEIRVLTLEELRETP
jgi:predicted nucleic acid-binding protein